MSTKPFSPSLAGRDIMQNIFVRQTLLQKETMNHAQDIIIASEKNHTQVSVFHSKIPNCSWLHPDAQACVSVPQQRPR